jgi:hypothetical protein
MASVKLCTTSPSPGKTGIAKSGGGGDVIASVGSTEIKFSPWGVAVSVGNSSVGNTVGAFGVPVGGIAVCEAGRDGTELQEPVKKITAKKTMNIFLFIKSTSS